MPTSLQLLNDALVLLAPLLLKLLVEWLSMTRPRPAHEDDEAWNLPPWQELILPNGRLFGWTAALALGLSCILRAVINSHFNWRLVSRFHAILGHHFFLTTLPLSGPPQQPAEGRTHVHPV